MLGDHDARSACSARPCTRRTANTTPAFLASFPAGAVVMAIIFYIIPMSVLGRGLMALEPVAFPSRLTALARGGVLPRRRIRSPEAPSSGSGERLPARRGGSAAREARVRAPGFTWWVSCNAGTGSPAWTNPGCSATAPRCARLVEQHRVDEIVVGVRDRRNGFFPTSRLLECKLEGVSIVDLPTFFERETGYVQLNSLSASWMIFSEGFSKTGFQKVLKRVFDISVSVVMLIATLPVMLLAALAIWHETGRPDTVSSESGRRVGANFRDPEVPQHARRGRAATASRGGRRKTTIASRRSGRFLED